MKIDTSQHEQHVLTGIFFRMREL